MEKLCDDCMAIMHQDVEGQSEIISMIHSRMFPQPSSDPWSKV